MRATAMLGDRSAAEAEVEAVTRRELLVGAFAALLVAGCGDDGGEGAAPGEDISTVKVAHKFGLTAVPSQPERIVAVGPTDEDAILALGFAPVGITDWWGNFATGDFWPWSSQLIAAAPTPPEVIPLDGEPHFEQIAALRPDLIIGQYCGMTREEYDTFSQLAPTVAQSAEYEDWQTPWQVMTRTIGTTLGREAEADELVRRVDEAFARERAANPAFGDTTVLYLERGDGVFTVRGANEPRVQVLTNLGFRVPEAYTNPGPVGVEFSDERMPEVIDAVDVAVWVTDPAGQAELEGNPLFQSLRVVREGRTVFVVDEVLSAAINWSSALSLPYAAQHLAAQLAEVV